ncbi:unnamed protein product [Hymenolepis diminuta]|uniref:Uncharacterized protein n=1 Tax=Hymenolepis diminuta TaxID=6216 RepID=A0A564YEN4_HYMDI|nr:unnamed protein product [Hymenolepis diminuta]
MGADYSSMPSVDDERDSSFSSQLLGNKISPISPRKPDLQIALRSKFGHNDSQTPRNPKIPTLGTNDMKSV